MIYAVEILDRKFVKIGFSSKDCVSHRISELQTGNPFEIKPILSVPGTLMQEKEMHSTLLDAFTRIRIPVPPNEWYPGKSDFFVRFLGELAFGANAGLAFLDKYNQAVKQPGKGIGSLEPNIKWPIIKERDRIAEASAYRSAVGRR